MLDEALKVQLKEIFSSLSADYIFDIRVSSYHEKRTELIELLEETAASSEKITCRIADGKDLSVNIIKSGKPTGIVFRAVPNGHEFSSLLLAILNLDGKGKNLPDALIADRVKRLQGDIHIVSYVSLTCTNCPDVAQAINAMVTINPNITHEIVDGAIYTQEVEKLNVQAVPTVYADGELLSVGRATFSDLLAKLESKYGLISTTEEVSPEEKQFDVLVIGGGPAGVSATIYVARKGLSVAILAEHIGGQVTETVGIENLIGTSYTTGQDLANNLRKHLSQYPVQIFENRRVTSVEINNGDKKLTTSIGDRFVTRSLIIATGASWRRLNVPGEAEYIGKGVAFCPHCDGPFYKGKHVAVIGGGNSGVEAAIDLAGICSKVTVIEFLDTLKSDKVLQDKLHSLPNVEVWVSTQTTAVLGDGARMNALKLKNRITEEERTESFDGVFVQIGLRPNSAAFSDVVACNKGGEIEINAHGRTSVPGIYAAGDVSSVPYKQIIISMGEGAKAALSAFEDRTRSLV